MSNTSLDHVHQSVEMTNTKGFRKSFSFLGPALLVSIGYMDPGNWATDLEAGSRFGYKLLFILLLSNLMALLLQSHSARLGIVQGKDLAQINRVLYPKKINFIFYLLAELAIIACDLAEVLGMALGLKLLFGIPLLYGVFITFINTLLILYLQKLGIRKLELFILGLILIITSAFIFQLVLSSPSFVEMGFGLVPKQLNTEELYISIGIIGATVMPHNLYLHSALVQTRKIENTNEAKKKAIRWNFVDSFFSLNLAFIVNASILILAASTFFINGKSLNSITEAHQLLAPVLESDLAPIAFAVALIAAGQSSTVTGTIAGQIIMEGYLNLKLNVFLRQSLTRLLAIVPAIIIISLKGESESESLLVASQVLLSLQLSFAIIPLIISVSSKHLMQDFAISKFSQFLSLIVAIIICSLNLYWLFGYLFSDFSKQTHLIQISEILFLAIFVSLLIAAIVLPFKKLKTLT